MPSSWRVILSRIPGRIIVTLLIGILALCAPLLAHAPLPLGSDVFSTSHFLQGFMKAFAEGDLYPRWTDRTNLDLGAPSFVLFPPLAYYGAGFASWLTGSIITGFKVYLLAIAALTAISFYAFAREWIEPGVPAAIASAIYLLLPYHVLDIYQRFALSETTAFVFFPLILLFARRVVQDGRPRDFAALSASYAGLIFTHIVSALSFSLFLASWLLWESHGKWRALVRPGLALACGAGLAAPALLPAVLEKVHVNISWIREMPNGDFRTNFIFKDDVLPGLGIKDPVKPPVLKSAHAQLLLAAAAAALALALTSSELRRRRRDVLALTVGCAAAYFLQLEISTPIWRIVPELASIQFPWRLQTIMVLTAAALSGFCIASSWRRPAAWGILGAAVLVNLFLARQNAYLKPFQYDENVNQDALVREWREPSFTPVAFQPYKQFKRMQIEMPRASFVEGSGQVTVTQWASSSRRLELSGSTGGTVQLRSFWFPGWTATIDGSPLPLRPSSPYGVTRFDVAPGRHAVELRFGATPIRRVAGLAGFGSILATVVLAGASRRRTVASPEL